jgi:trk system potassium uptake protein TrkA
MRILVIGAGTTGFHVASHLLQESHDVVLVDRDEARLREVEEQLDLMTVHGNGASPPVLAQAGLPQSDLVVAVTNSDEVNVLICAFARLAGVRHKIARISQPEFIEHPEYDLSKIGVDLAVNQKREAAADLLNALRFPGAVEVVDLLDGRILAVGLTVHMDSPLLRAPLRSFPEPGRLAKIRFIAGLRGSDLLVPRGDTTFMIGDTVYLTGRPEDVSEFIRWAWPEAARFDKTIIGGGGDLGLSLARLIEGQETPAVLIERDPAQAARCAEQLDQVSVVKGDALDQETLEQVGVPRNSAFVAAMAHDEDNIMACLVANKLGARFTAAAIDKSAYLSIIRSLSLVDRTINPHLTMVSAILHFIRGRNVSAASIFSHLPGEMLEVVLSEHSRWTGGAIRGLRIPEGANIVAILRGDELMPATGETEMRSGDRVVVFCSPGVSSKLKAVLHK